MSDDPQVLYANAKDWATRWKAGAKAVRSDREIYIRHLRSRQEWAQEYLNQQATLRDGLLRTIRELRQRLHQEQQARTTAITLLSAWTDPNDPLHASFREALRGLTEVALPERPDPEPLALTIQVWLSVLRQLLTMEKLNERDTLDIIGTAISLMENELERPTP